MIELRDDALEFSFPEVHPRAVLRVAFQRTLRIPDDDDTYPLPPGLGRFPVRHVDDFAERVSGTWLRRGGVMLPMYQSEAMWLNFTSPSDYPFALKVATGKINAVTGEPWDDGLHRDPQDYMVIPGQPWLDGYNVEKGMIRQFVAMPLGSGYSVEEQLTGKAEHGGLQIIAYPMKREAAERLFARTQVRESSDANILMKPSAKMSLMSEAADMGLAPGGRMRQEIYDDEHDFTDWDTRRRSRCFVHLANAMVWRSVTGENPPTVAPTSEEYTRAGLPWFDYYGGDRKALNGAEPFGGLKTVSQLGKEKGDVPLPENTSVTPENVVKLRAKLAPGQVREGSF